MIRSTVFLGALATHRLVGREHELEAIRRAIFPDDERSFQCLMLRADGGKGKTRLLREVEDRLSLPVPEAHNPDHGLWMRDTVVVLPLIDLGDVALHTVTGFLREVRLRFTSISPAYAAAFTRFDTAWLQYETARDGQADFSEVYKRTQRALAAFQEDYQKLTEQRRVVWVLDTLEQIFAVPPEIAALLQDVGVESQELGLTTYNWLLKFIAERPGNTTVLLAGRPEPERWLQDVAESLSEPAQPPLDVTDFTLEETGTYLQCLCEQLQADTHSTTVAENLYIATDEPEERKGLHLLTQGNPIRLALYIDLFVNADPLPEPFRNLADIQNQSAAQIHQLQEQLDQELLTYLARRLTEPEPQVLEYLSVMRRGLDRTRLKHLWGTADDAVVNAVFKSLPRFSFIKERGDRLFLHDEFYSIYQRNLVRQPYEAQQAERARQRDIFERLIAFCTNRASELTQEIYRVQEQLAKIDQNDPAYLGTKDKFRNLRAERLHVRAERSHYGLYLDPKEGLNKRYFREAGQAFLANEQELDDLLQSEVNIFFFGGNADLNRQQAGLNAEEWKILRFQALHERVSRWIRRLTLLPESREQAQQFARRVQERRQELARRYYPEVEQFHEQPGGRLMCRLFGREWDACRCFAALYEGTKVLETLRELDTISEQLEEELRQDRQQQQGLLSIKLPEFKWRLLNVLAECLLFAGFGYANIYDFKAAEKRYRRADRILERTEFRTLHAEVKNDLSRVLGELGALHQALVLCEEGLDVRKEYGFDYLSGLSTNTMALIYTRNARPTPARYYAEKALNLFRQINNPRGIGLALIQVAEARRRIWGLTAEEARDDRASRDKIDRTLLQEVEPLLQEAEDLFSKQFRSDAGLIEVWNERGCLYRDWAAFFGLPEAQSQFEQARDLFEKAMHLAQENNYRQHYLSACINMAWLYGRCKLPTEAEQMARQARETVDRAYLFNIEKPVDVNSATNVVNFRELSKLSSLYAVVLLADSADLEALLREHIFAITYLQLFSPYEPFYLGVTKRQLSRLVSRFTSEQDRLKSLTHKIIEEYHLRSLEESIGGPLQAEVVINDALNRGDAPDYLD